MSAVAARADATKLVKYCLQTGSQRSIIDGEDVEDDRRGETQRFRMHRSCFSQSSIHSEARKEGHMIDA